MLRPVDRVAGVIAAVLVVAGCAGSSRPAQAFTGPCYDAKLYLSDLAKAPEFRDTTVPGRPLSLAAYRGHLVVLNFWGSWCDSCRAEAPMVAVVARELYPAGVRFIGVDMRDEPASARAFMQTFRVTYPSVSDTAAAVALACRGTVPLQALPDTVIINRAGRIAATIVGTATYADLTMLIAKAGQET